ncbi:MAG: methionyl-tRNA formyltransferase [Coriobacteriia bacterium]|nr:methionyl-tRNA formyltransferase [Coriobacteriia bacterium]
MRVVFMGTPAFAVPSLEALHEHHEVVAVVTMPDRVSGRGGELRPCEVKVAAETRGLTVLHPTTLRGEVADHIRALRPDVICVAAFGMLLPPVVLEIPPHGCINVHASLLPRYRGAAPVQRVILDAEPETGVSIMRMEEGLDTGPYALQVRVPVGERYAAELEAELARVGAEALVTVLAKLPDVRWEVQDESGATYAPKVSKNDVALTPELSIASAYARVRAATHRAPARACVSERELTVVRAHPTEADVAPGGACIVSGMPVLGFTGGALVLDVVRPAGRGDMPGDAWARGAHIAEGVCWRCTR